MPPGATGDVYLYAFDHLVAPRAAAFDPTWVIVSAGFDAHDDSQTLERFIMAASGQRLLPKRQQCRDDDGHR